VADRFQLADVKYIQRIVVGNHDPKHMKTEAEVGDEMAKVNALLSGTPGGVILGIEKNFAIYHVGEHQVVMQYFVYHIGFTRKPMSLS
jgi:hypothetical protein